MHDHIADVAIILTGASLAAAAFGWIALVILAVFGLVVKVGRTVLK